MAFTQYRWLTKLIFLLLMISRTPPVVDTRPARGSPTSDIIAGNEFLKLFMERDEVVRNLHSSEYQGHADGVSSRSLKQSTSGDDYPKSSIFGEGEGDGKNDDSSVKIKSRSNARSLDYRVQGGGNTNRHSTNDGDDGKQVVKLVTSGSKIVFLEEFDDADDAIVDAVARDIDLKREKVKKVNNNKAVDENRFYQESKSAPSDEFKVVAVSVSSSSKRGSPNSNQQAAKETPKQVSKFTIKTSQTGKSESRYLAGSTTTARSFKVQTTSTSTTSRPFTSTTATTMSTSAAAVNDIDDFINRSHKSEFSIEEAEPLTMSQRQHKMRRAHASIPDRVTDSENSASTNVQNVLASPALISSASVRSSSIAATSVNRNSTQSQNLARHARINQSGATYDSNSSDIVNSDGGIGTADVGGLVEEKLLPFQTVIYHDTKEGHGPQSRSISYSSISQNVDDIQTWKHTGILAEAQRNVNESLKPVIRPASPPQAIEHSQVQAHPHESEPAKFYSIPAKMYSVPSKFYSEPSKVYSQPAKVYGEPEKFHSEPAKVYGQPSKFYSEPAKVYSQPSKVYGEPAKTYWPQTTSIITTTTSTSTTTTTMTPASQSIITTFSPFSSPFNLTSRRPPAIVSRIAFGEAQSSTPPPQPAGFPMNFGQNPTTRPPSGYHSENYHHHTQQNPYHSYRNHQEMHGHGQNTQSRRVLFNLDKLPYDLLNAPEQHLLEPDLSKSHPSPCSETESSPTLSNTKQQQQQHLRQHPSFSAQHSNQNAKGLPNRDLVKCVSKFNAHNSPTTSESTARRPPSAPIRHHFTTERSHIEDLYQPTPEQNYEIEESVSVMTNGRPHPRTFGRKKTSTNIGDDSEVHDTALVRQSNNSKNNNHPHYLNNNNDYNNDNGDGVNGDGDGGVDADGDADTDTDGNAEDDDSKVAYVVEGRNYRKYRVEEKTDDGFIVGEFGVVDHNDGNLRGVRYTADSTINPSLIQKALLTFLKLK